MLEMHSSDESDMSPATAAGSLRIVRSLLDLCMGEGYLTRAMESLVWRPQNSPKELPG